jgi:hypothetical protein
MATRTLYTVPGVPYDGPPSAVREGVAIVRPFPGGYYLFERTEDAVGHPSGHVVQEGSVRP